MIVLRNVFGQLNIPEITETVKSILKEVYSTSFGPGSVLFPPPYSMLKEPYFKPSEVLELVVKNQENQELLLECGLGSCLWKINKILSELTLNSYNCLDFGKTDAGLSPYNLRLLTHEGEGIGMHTENIFLHDLDKLVKSSLINNVDVEDALSYFLVLNQPEQGGSLRVFGEDTPGEAGPETQSHELVNGHEELNYGSSIKLETGDLVVFRAARLWHQITRISGTEPRITIGGFMARSVGGSGWQVWS